MIRRWMVFGRALSGYPHKTKGTRKEREEKKQPLQATTRSLAPLPASRFPGRRRRRRRRVRPCKRQRPPRRSRRPSSSPLCLPTGSGSSVRPRRAARSAVRCELVAAAAASASSAAPAPVAAPRWAQTTVVIPPQRRGCHIITHKIMHAIRSDLSEFKCGLAHLFLHHTSASLTLNENYDPDVQTDTETFLSRIVPEGPSAPWRHTIEGSDDMPAHIKSSMFGCALTIPITDGRLNMGTWQGIWLCEHRDYATPRTVVITLSGI
uniref:Secondary thiamine-phosphate synthase enzyme n=1 Tax=Hordeum vulgare subsp. vulgare TaxID=112509 RepID=A0A8I6YKG5_HORVV